MQDGQVAAFREVDATFFLLDGGTHRCEEYVTVVQVATGALYDFQFGFRLLVEQCLFQPLVDDIGARRTFFGIFVTYV